MVISLLYRSKDFSSSEAVGIKIGFADLTRKQEVFARPLEGYAKAVMSPEQAGLIAAWRDARRMVKMA
jgi:hypothetical protein